MSLELRANLHASQKEKKTIKSNFIKVTINSEVVYVRMLVSPLDNSYTKDLYLICFQEEESIIFEKKEYLNSDEYSGEVEALNLEIAKTKEHLMYLKIYMIL